jgi:hypothetical protein
MDFNDVLLFGLIWNGTSCSVYTILFLILNIKRSKSLDWHAVALLSMIQVSFFLRLGNWIATSLN